MKIIDWIPTAYRMGWRIGEHIAYSWKPIFAFPRAQDIVDRIFAQIIGVVRRARLCSSGVPLKPYQ